MIQAWLHLFIAYSYDAKKNYNIRLKCHIRQQVTFLEGSSPLHRKGHHNFLGTSDIKGRN